MGDILFYKSMILQVSIKSSIKSSGKSSVIYCYNYYSLLLLQASYSSACLCMSVLTLCSNSLNDERGFLVS